MRWIDVALGAKGDKCGCSPRQEQVTATSLIDLFWFFSLGRCVVVVESVCAYACVYILKKSFAFAFVAV
jgi:hypothetical protein